MRKVLTPGAFIHKGLHCVALLLLAAPGLAQQPEHECRTYGQPEQKAASAESKKLFSIQVEDAMEAELIAQQLKIKPELMRGHSFYYCGNEQTSRLLAKYGFEPSEADGDEVFSRVVRVAREGKEKEGDLLDLGVTLVLREREYWVVQGTLRQLRVLEKCGYVIKPVGPDEPHPRQVKITVFGKSQVEEAGKIGVDIYGAAPADKEKDVFVIHGGAFDYAIDALKKKGFNVEILPDPPGVTR